MKQYDESNKEQVAEFVLEQIRHHILFTLATVDNDNRPWVVCLGLTVDDNVDIIWKSSAIAEHSKQQEHRQHSKRANLERPQSRKAWGFERLWNYFTASRYSGQCWLRMRNQKPVSPTPGYTNG